MATHLAHKLPWASIGDVVKARCALSKDKRELVAVVAPETKAAHDKVFAHHARCLVTALKEFAASDASTPEERAPFDGSRWSVTREPNPDLMGEFCGVLLGYFEINLILMDPETFVPILLHGQSSWGWTIEMSRDEYPEWLADHLALALENRRDLKPVTPEVLQVLRDHAGLLFRILHSTQGENRALDPERVARYLPGYIPVLRRDLSSNCRQIERAQRAWSQR